MAKPKSNRRRKISKERAQNDSGWVALVVGVLIATFFGGAVRALLSERQVHQWIDKQISKEDPAFQIDFQSAQVVLSDGWMPKFGLLVKELKVVAKDTCRVPYGLNVKEVFLPGSLSVLWGERLRFGTIRADSLHIEEMQTECAQKNLESQSSVAQVGQNQSQSQIQNKNQNQSQSQSEKSSRSEDLPVDAKIHGESPLKKYFSERWAIDLASLSRWIEGFSFKDVQIKGLEGPLTSVEIPEVRLEVEPTGRAATLKTSVRLPEEFEQTLGTKPVEFDR